MIINKIPGAEYYPEWIDLATELELLNKIEEGIWGTSLKRRVQQFGPVYNYTTRKLEMSHREIPNWIKNSLFFRLRNFFPEEPNQIIVNEYEKGQGITKHIDAPVFGPVIASLSLLSNTNMTFGQHGGEEVEHLLERRSLIIISGDSRSKWHHYISPVAEKRISITFRTSI